MMNGIKIINKISLFLPLAFHYLGRRIKKK